MLSEYMIRKSKLKDRGRKHLTTIFNASKIINCHVNNLLNYNLILKNKFNIVVSEVDIRTFIEQTIDILHEQAEA